MNTKTFAALNLFLLFCSPAFADSTSQIEAESVHSSSSSPSAWSVAGGFTFHGVAGGASPLVGPALQYSLSDSNQLLARTFFSVLTAGDDGAYEAGLAWRHFFSAASKTGLLIESDAAWNVVQAQSVFTVGQSIGMIYRINNDAAFLGTAGFDFSRGYSAFGPGLEGNIYISPKLSTSVAFYL